MEKKALQALNIKKGILIFVSAALVYLLVTSLLSAILLPNRMAFADFGDAQTLYFMEEQTDLKETALVSKFFSLNDDKWVSKTPERILKHMKPSSFTKIFYDSDKGRSLLVDEQGRVFIAQSKSEIRNKSSLHWLWWALEFNKQGIIYYRTEPDQAVVELVKEMKASLK
ncbi:hypothetical protein [Paenibacillus lutrae]|uniref:Uncharacterized protein n=1 Tax=Paenibacillus lutrae TaxID=2078573 RepID=A0A7X3JZ82_9BACL|nr:hypothetical protein [Paenibacillus lutrae]MVO99918.1 hypothetical protein [Paenibacillus lutrae]